MKFTKMFFSAILILVLSIKLIHAEPNNTYFLMQPDSSNTGAEVDSSGVIHQTIVLDTISATPTESEIHNLFLAATRGEKDPFRIVALVASRKDAAIPALEQFLIQPPDTTKDTTYTGIKSPNKEYAIYALDAIATPKAEEFLLQIAKTNTDKDIKGLAIKTLSNNIYYRLKNARYAGFTSALIPDKEIVHLLLQNADDTSYVSCCSERTGDIAREGLKNWTGKNYGRIAPERVKEKIYKRLGLTLEQLHENWWQKNSANLIWDNTKEHFEIK